MSVTTTLLAALVLSPASGHRPPSVPLVVHDPYFSVWSPADRLADGNTVHWTGKPQPLVSLVRVDGRAFRLLGAGSEPALPQIGTEVTPTRTIATFEGAGVRLRLTFLTPSLPNDLDVLARPATYVTWSATSADGRPHEVAAYFAASARLAANTPDQPVTFARRRYGGLKALSVGTVEQPVLGKKGDDLRIDWGRAYLAGLGKASARIGSDAVSRTAFARSGMLPADDAAPRPAGEGALALSLSLGRVGAAPAERTAIIAYDDEWSIEYFGRRLRPWWRRARTGGRAVDAAGMLRSAASEFDVLRQRSETFDARLTADMTAAGGEDYAYLGALAYRQSLGAQKLVADPNGAPLLLSKENFSNGCIATVDVIYPAAPLTLLFSPALTRATLQGPLAYAASGRWKFPFAPHDLGTYPKANGQVYGGGETSEENQMPVEETGNLLILLAALAKVEGNADYAGRFWPTLRGWAEYLASKGYDPESQLSTDDFAGHLARNVNLSVKAIEGLASFARLAEMRGERADAAKYGALAKEFAAKWMTEAANGSPDAGTRLAFGREGTWSQKYNLVWDRILGLNLFPASLPAREAAFYRTKMNRYGLPLDTRAGYTKLDWTVWSATLSGKRDDFEAILAPTIRYLDETPDRVPMNDWHETTTPKKVGFQARSVVGGVFLKLLDDPAMWAKWTKTGARFNGEWAPIPARPVFRPVTADARSEALLWRYRFDAPVGEWTAPGYDDSAWPEGPAGFGTAGTPGSVVRTKWSTPGIWLRRTFDLPKMRNPRLMLHHDEDAEVWINGVKAATLGGYTSQYEPFEISPAARKALRVGRNVVAIRVRQTTGGQYVDLGFVEAEPKP